MKQFFDPCRRHRRNLSLLAAGALPDAEKDPVEKHLAACEDCRKYFAEVKAVTAPLTNMAEGFPQLQPSQSAQARWSVAIRAAGRPVIVRRLTLAMIFREWWQAVIWPHRRVWAGLAAVWVMILFGNLSLPGHAQSLAGKSSPQEIITAFKNQQKILAELLADHSMPREADRQKIFSPSPRTETSMVMTA